VTSTRTSHNYRNVFPISPQLEDEIVRHLLFGNSQECALFDAPPEIEETNFFLSVLETVIAFANSFGGWMIFGVAPTWLGNVTATEDGRCLSICEMLESSPSRIDVKATTSLIKALRGAKQDAILGEVEKSGLGKLMAATDFRYTVYSREWNCSRSESVERLLESKFLSTYEIPFTPGQNLMAIRVEPLIDGEIRHIAVNGGETIVRVGEMNKKRSNLIGINWSIYHSLRLPVKGSPIKHKTQFERFFFGDSIPECAERVKARALLCEFLNTLKPGRRTDLAIELTCLCWQQLENRDLFKIALETLYTAELGGRHVNEQFWRDHVVHQLYTLLLGIHLWNSCPSLAQKLEKEEKATLIWTMASTCHDLGYPFELFIVNLLQQLSRLAPYSSETLPILPRVKDLGRRGEVSFWRLISDQLWPDGHADTPMLESIFDSKSQSKSAHLLDHGIVSALLWLALISKVRKEGSPEDILGWELEVAAAIAAHNLKLSDLKPASKKVKTFESVAHPFVILLALCDSLQEWDRTAAARHVLIPGAVQVQISTAPGSKKSAITARFGLDSRVAAGIAEVFDKDRGCFRLGEDLSVSTESFFKAINASSDENMRKSTEDPWMKLDKKKNIAEFITKVGFAPFGMVLREPEAGSIYLDTGNQLTHGVIDNHAAEERSGTALLVYRRPELVKEHVQSLAPGEVTLVLHNKPDMDAITAAFFCQELLVRGKVPEQWEPLARYVDLADQSLLPIDWDFPSTPWGIFHAFISTAYSDSVRVRRGFMVLRYLTAWLERNRVNPNTDPIVCFRDAFKGPHPFERVQELAGKDYDEYLACVARGELEEIELELPMLPLPINPKEPFIQKKTKILITKLPVNVRLRQRPGFLFLPQWAAMDGYGGTVTHFEQARKDGKKWKPGVTIIGSVAKDGSCNRPTFWGLGHLLDEEESKWRDQRGGPKRSTADADRRAPNYENDDPWYDARDGILPGGIINVPRTGTYLTVKEIEKLLMDTKTWIAMGEAKRP
jgi:hypothetical protein